MRILSNFFSFIQNKTKREYNYILVAVLFENEGKLVIFRQNKLLSTIEQIAERKFKYTNSWENLLEDIDQILFEIETEKRIKCDEILYVISQSIIDIKSNDISEPYITKIKNINRELNLKPIGYISHSEIVIANEKKQNNLSVNSIFIEVNNTVLTSAIYIDGEIVYSNIISRTNDIFEDIKGMLNEASSICNLPHRIILYGEGDFEKVYSKLIEGRWPKALFAQLPKIEIVSDETINEGLKDALINYISMKSSQFNNSLPKGDSKDIEFVIGKDIAYIDKEEKELAPVKKEQKFSSLNFFDNRKILPLYFKNKSNLFLIIGIVVFSISIFFPFIFLHKAKIFLYFRIKPVDSVVVISKDIPAYTRKEIFNIQKSIPTTGEKITGVYAKGEITVFNTDFRSITLKKGTILQAQSTGKYYTLDENIEVASASQKITEEGNVLTITGKNKTSVTASEYGPEYNLDKNSKLFIKDIPSNQMYALVENAIKGGEKKEITTVSQKDKEKLNHIVENEIKKIIKNKKSIKNSIILPQLSEIKILKNEFSHEVAEETDTLSLKSEVAVNLYYLDLIKAKNELIKKLKPELDSSSIIVPSRVTFKVIDAKKKNGNISVTFHVYAIPKPIIDKENVKKKLTWKNLNEIKDIIKKEFRAEAYEISLKSYNLPILSSFTPILSSNISVEILTLE